MVFASRHLSVLDLGRGKEISGFTLLVHIPYVQQDLGKVPFRATPLGTHFMGDPHMNPAHVVETIVTAVEQGMRSQGGTRAQAAEYVQRTLTELGKESGTATSSNSAAPATTTASTSTTVDSLSSTTDITTAISSAATATTKPAPIESHAAALVSTPTSEQPPSTANDNGTDEDMDLEDGEIASSHHPSPEVSEWEGSGTESSELTEVDQLIDEPVGPTHPITKGRDQLMLDYPPPDRLSTHYDLRPTAERLGQSIITAEPTVLYSTARKTNLRVPRRKLTAGIPKSRRYAPVGSRKSRRSGPHHALALPDRDALDHLLNIPPHLWTVAESNIMKTAANALVRAAYTGQGFAEFRTDEAETPVAV